MTDVVSKRTSSVVIGISDKEGSQLVNIDGLARYTHCAQPLSAFLRSRRSSTQNS